MERLILLEHTTPYDSLDFVRAASGGGIPGGVCGLGSLLSTYPPVMVNKNRRLILAAQTTVAARCGVSWSMVDMYFFLDWSKSKKSLAPTRGSRPRFFSGFLS